MDRHRPAGQTLPPGTYTLAVENWDGEDLIETRRRQRPRHGRRGSVERDGEVVLTMQGGVERPGDAVSGLRQPQG
jgi:hypothetical protein